MTNGERERLIQLDSQGIFPGVGESAEAFLLRAGETFRVHAALEAELAQGKEVTVFDEIRLRQEDRIPQELVEEAAAITGKLYGFEMRHVPGFFLSHDVGPLWGGCLIGDPDQNLSVFLLRNAFRKRARWLGYERSELLAHELCHAARQALKETTLEEFFAYQTGGTFLRRYFGNCFIHERDALLFLLPILLLPVVQLFQFFSCPGLPVWPFWLLAALYPAFLLWRNARSRHVFRAAEKALERCQAARKMPVLFRLTRQELLEIAGLGNREELEQYVRSRAEQELRWALIGARFIFCNTQQVEENQ